MRARRNLILTLLLSCAVASAADWPQFRGPNRDAKSPETGLLASWPKDGPRLLWKIKDLGEGYAGPSVVGNRFFLQGQIGPQQYVAAFDVNTGKQLWTSPTGKAFNEDHGNGPRGTPTVDGNRLYAVSTDGTLVCLDIATGKRIWALNYTERFNAKMPTWAFSESPLVEGDRLIVTPGAPGAGVVALDKNTGDLVWKSQDDGAAYASPMAVATGGTRAVALLTKVAAIGLDMKDGALLWRFPQVANRTANVASPVVHDGYVFYSSDYGTGCLLVKAEADGKAAEVYFNKDMRNHYMTSVLVGDYLYGYSSEILTAMEFKTGKVAWRNRSVGKGNCIYADERLYCVGEEGVIGLIEPSPEAYKEVSRFEIYRGAYPTWTPPVLANGRMYIREQDNLYCYNVKR